jgi:hypothetical protein
VHYIEDRHSHAKVHNQLLKANNILVMGNSFEALQIAQSCRTYLDETGRFDVKIMLLSPDKSQVRKTMGKGMDDEIMKLLKRERISY